MTDKFKPELPFVAGSALLAEGKTITWIEDAAGRNVCDLFHKSDGDHFYIKPNAVEHADFIIQACNMHDEMIDVFKAYPGYSAGPKDYNKWVDQLIKLLAKLNAPETSPESSFDHEPTRQNDEYFCPKCGKRWDFEDEPPECVS